MGRAVGDAVDARLFDGGEFGRRSRGVEGSGSDERAVVDRRTSSRRGSGSARATSAPARVATRRSTPWWVTITSGPVPTRAPSRERGVEPGEHRRVVLAAGRRRDLAPAPRRRAAPASASSISSVVEPSHSPPLRSRKPGSVRHGTPSAPGDDLGGAAGPPEVGAVDDRAGAKPALGQCRGPVLGPAARRAR